MGVGIQVAIVVCVLALWVAFLILFEKRNLRKDRRASGQSGETPASDADSTQRRS